MKKISAVIGCNYGDEGKGLVVDYLASQEKSLVVRYNGGAQAGHTVVTPEGERHVFSHVGSGYFTGADTFLSKYFIVNPILFFKERKDFKQKRRVYVDGAAPVTTPYDMMINQMLEERRGGQRHGSCGAGINETVTRHEIFPFKVRTLQQSNLFSVVCAVRDKYVPKRLAELGLPPLDETQKGDGIVRRFVEECLDFLDEVMIINNPKLSDFDHDQIIFEGAQGLRLDEHHRHFPHVTRSKTGLHNIILLAEQAGFGEIDVHYPTRAYLTRHGAGPLENECLGKPFPDIEDKTNIPNLYQGALRFGFLNIWDLQHEINLDANWARNVKINRKMVVTCIDQVPKDITYIRRGKTLSTSVDDFLYQIFLETSARELFFSNGPTRKHVSKFEAWAPE